MSQLFNSAFMPVLILSILGALAVVGTLFIGRFLRPRVLSEKKIDAYECGEKTIGTSWVNFNVRFYLIAIIFIIFDIEAALIFPVATIIKPFANTAAGLAFLVSFLLFIIILIVGLIYCWRKGDFNWVKSYIKKDGGQ